MAQKWKLQKNACQNRGFILDNFPKTYQECQELFMIKKKINTDEDEDEEKFE